MLRILSVTVSLMSLSSNAYSQVNVTEYSVYYVEKETIKIDGVLMLGEWDDLETVENAFHFPWRGEKAPSTKFKAAWNEDGLYFSFEVMDTNIVLANSAKGEKAVDHSDRVEIFFDPTQIEQNTPPLKKIL